MPFKNLGQPFGNKKNKCNCRVLKIGKVITHPTTTLLHQLIKTRLS
jgi:hypothetical protein